MKGIALFLGFLLSFGTIFGQDSTFTAGNDAYAAGDYKTALTAYNQLVADELLSAELYYNLGNTYYRLNEYGKSIWAYERALKIKPADKNCRYNLAFVNGRTKAEISTENEGILMWLEANLFGISINFWAYLSVIFSLTFSIACYFFFTTKKQKIKNVSLSISLTSIVLLIGTIVLASFNANYLTAKTHGIIITNKATVLAEPSETSTKNFELEEGSKVEVLRTNEKWIEIDVKGHSGWVSRKDLWEI